MHVSRTILCLSLFRAKHATELMAMEMSPAPEHLQQKDLDKEVEQPKLSQPQGDFSNGDQAEADWRNVEEEGGEIAWNVKVPILPCWDESDDGVPPVRLPTHQRALLPRRLLLSSSLVVCALDIPRRAGKPTPV
jgi:hypothetical protein